MSHAMVLVALPPGTEDIEAGVAEQMRPFDENGEWFRDGSRWDWYEIGGRYKGRLAGKNVCTKEALPQDFVAYAFLRDYQWNERSRMGWFGSPVKTECEIAGSEPNICKHVQNGYAVISWGEDEEDGSAPRWVEKFRKRFIDPLPAGTVLVGVDYHV